MAKKNLAQGHKQFLGLPVQVEECLAPRDREVRTEAKQMALTFTRKQDVYA